MLKLTNTLSGKVEEFKAINDKQVGIYTCGPTVYNYAHIGNLRAYIFADVLKRSLIYSGYDVNHVINVTDIGHLTSDADEGEDKMTKALKREGKPLTLKAMREVADFYFEEFKNDLKKLNIIPPDQFPFASDHIKENVTLIQTLIEKGFTYNTSDGIYFDISKFPSYGALGGKISDPSAISRIGINPEKRNPQDFALWKFNSNIGFEAPFGMGFPGWHVECSSMSMRYLGETFDIHTGGIDHIRVHHNNEIAQSESATGKKFVNYWLHSAFVNLDEAKMAKSDDNFITLNSLIEKGVHPLAYRYFILQARYNTPINYSDVAISGAQNGFELLLKKISQISSSAGSANHDFLEKFKKCIENDLNTPEAISLLHTVVDSNISNEEKLATLAEFDNVLGLRLLDISEKLKPTKEVLDKLSQIDELRSQKKYDESDKLRNSPFFEQYIVENSAEGSTATKRLTPDI